VAIQPDPGDPTRSALVVGGTAAADYLELGWAPDNAVVLMDQGWVVRTFSAPGGAAFAHLLVYGYGGDDGISLRGNLTVPALVFGGDGDDNLNADCSSANNVLVGGAGNDWVYGGNGRDLLIGGLGADTLRAAYGGSILVGGYTDYDANPQALIAVMREWGRTDADYGTRVKHLQGSLGGGRNGSYVLTAKTVHDDAAVDRLYGWAGMDWFFVGGKGKNADTTDKAGGEVVPSI
jgi:Ca2+-binding RTX toxin-like protein